MSRGRRPDRNEARASIARIVMGIGSPRSDRPTSTEMKLARKNAVGLVYACCFPDSDALSEERERHAAFLQALVDTSNSLHDEAIDHIYIKHEKLYPYYDSNVDVIVAPDDWNRTIALLRARGYSPNVMFKEPDKIMFDCPDRSVSVHLHPGVTWNGVPYFSTDSLWENSTPSPDGHWRELTPEYDFLVNIAHNLFENYDVSLGDTLYFRRFLDRHDVDARRLAGIARSHGWGYGFEQGYSQILKLVDGWNTVSNAKQVPGHLLQYPYRLSPLILARTYSERIMRNIQSGRVRRALREIYAYPVFYALKRRHDLPALGR